MQELLTNNHKYTQQTFKSNQPTLTSRKPEPPTEVGSEQNSKKSCKPNRQLFSELVPLPRPTVSPTPTSARPKAPLAQTHHSRPIIRTRDAQPIPATATRDWDKPIESTQVLSSNSLTSYIITASESITHAPSFIQLQFKIIHKVHPQLRTKAQPPSSTPSQTHSTNHSKAVDPRKSRPANTTAAPLQAETLQGKTTEPAKPRPCPKVSNLPGTSNNSNSNKTAAPTRRRADPLEIALAAIFGPDERSVKLNTNFKRNNKNNNDFITYPSPHETIKTITPSSTINHKPMLTHHTQPLSPIMASSSPMDLGPPPAKSARTDISNQYQTKSEATKAKKNPEKPQPVEEEFVVQPLGRKYDEPKTKKLHSTAFSQIPTLTLRMLMPGDSKDADKDDKRMDLAFKQEKVEFLLVARPVTQHEIKAGYITESVNSSVWDIPEIEDFEDCMGQAVNAICKKNIKLIHQVYAQLMASSYNKLNINRHLQVQWSSVASQTGIGAFSIKTDNMDAMEELRANIRGLVLGAHCFESFPRDALLKQYGLTIYFPRACAHMEPDLLIQVLRECNPGLKGKGTSTLNNLMNTNTETSIIYTGQIETIDCKIFKDTNANVRRRGVKIISFTGDEAFLDSLHSFPANFPFNVKLANCYIRGGDRVKERYAGTKPQRPKMAMSAVRELLRRNSTTITNEALDEEDRLASNMRNTNIAGKINKKPLLSPLTRTPQSPHRETKPVVSQQINPPRKTTTDRKRTLLHPDGKPTHKSHALTDNNLIQLNTHPLHLFTDLRMEDMINDLDLLDIKPDLLITTRADHLPPGWDSHLFNDANIFTDFSTDTLEFTLLKTRADGIKAWSAPSDYETRRLTQAVREQLPRQLENCFSVIYLTDIGLPTILVPAQHEGDMGLLRHLIRTSTISGFSYETIPTQYPVNQTSDRASDIMDKSVYPVSRNNDLSYPNPCSYPFTQAHHPASTSEPKTNCSIMSFLNINAPNKYSRLDSNKRRRRSSIDFIIMFLNLFSEKHSQASLQFNMARQIVTPRQLLPCGYNPPPFAANLDTDIECDLVRFVILCRPISESELENRRLRRATPRTLWDTPNQDVSIRLYDNMVGTLTGPDLPNPFQSFTSSESTGLTLFALGTRDITLITRITAAIRRLVIDDMCFDSFPVDIFDGVWSSTRQLDNITEWYHYTHTFLPGPRNTTNTLFSQVKPHRQRQGLDVQSPRTSVPFQLDIFYRNTLYAPFPPSTR